MRIKYSINTLLILTAVIAIAIFLQMRLNRNTFLLKDAICNPDSRLHAGDQEHAEVTQISITEVEPQSSVLDYLLFRRQVEIHYNVESTKIRRETAHYRIRQRTGNWYVDIPYASQTAHKTKATVGPFGFTNQ